MGSPSVRVYRPWGWFWGCGGEGGGKTVERDGRDASGGNDSREDLWFLHLPLSDCEREIATGVSSCVARPSTCTQRVSGDSPYEKTSWFLSSFVAEDGLQRSLQSSVNCSTKWPVFAEMGWRGDTERQAMGAGNTWRVSISTFQPALVLPFVLLPSPVRSQTPLTSKTGTSAARVVETATAATEAAARRRCLRGAIL